MYASVSNILLLQRIGCSAGDIFIESNLPKNIIPSLERFVGIMACIDISGFTALSTLLSAQDLMIHINSFFETLISIIKEWGGDIIKFAGDSVYVIWKISSIDTDILRKQLFDVLNCLISAHNKCGNYEIKFSATSTHLSQASFKRSSCFSDSNIIGIEPILSENSFEMSHVLSIHSGISAGIIGSCDVGHNDRWENLVLGSPVDEVGKATTMAPKGKIVLSPSAMKLLSNETFDSIFVNVQDGYCQFDHAKWHHNKYFSTRPLVDCSHNINDSVDMIVRREDHSNGLTKSFLMNILNRVTELHTHNAYRLLTNVSLSTCGELRSVVTLFIKIWDITVDLHCVDDFSFTGIPIATTNKLQNKSDIFHSLGFTKKFPKEKDSDESILQKMQTYITIIIASLERNGGQLRQFILDDKGLIGIGSIGLRGSATRNPSESGLLAAFDMLREFNDINVTVSIGVTQGKSFCGKVGSKSRYEYAILGRSVNLAARLMNTATKNSIFCDDCLHAKASDLFSFRELGPFLAKGYSKPVLVFEVIGTNAQQTSDLVKSMQQQNTNLYRSLSPESITIHFRPSEIEASVSFFRNENGSKRRTSHSASTLFERKRKILVIQGPPKFGKSSLLDLIAQELLLNSTSTSISASVSNVVVSINSLFHQSDRSYLCSVWKALFQEFSLQIAVLVSREPAELFQSITTTMEDYFVHDLHYIYDLLPTNFTCTSECVHTVLRHSGGDGPDKMRKIEILFVAIMQAYLNVVPDSDVYFFIYNAHKTDISSWDLILKCIHALPNIHLVLSYCKIPDEYLELNYFGSFYWNFANIEGDISIWQNDPSTEFYSITLGLLDEGIVLDFISGFLSEFNVMVDDKLVDDDEEILRKLVRFVKGNPMSIYLLLRSKDFQHRDGGKLDKMFEMRPFQKRFIAISSAQLTSVEDFIFYRFDKLNSIYQIVLKVASVVCFHEEVLCPEAVHFILARCKDKYKDKENDKEHSENSIHSSSSGLPQAISLLQVSKSLHFLYNNNQFLTQLNTPKTSVFQSDKERLTIYGIMIDEEKHIYHESMAEYFIKFCKEKVSNPQVLADKYSVIGSHYHISKKYKESIIWFYKAAEIFDVLGEVHKCNSLLEISYVLYLKLKTDLGINIVRCGDEGVFQMINSIFFSLSVQFEHAHAHVNINAVSEEHVHVCPNITILMALAGSSDDRSALRYIVLMLNKLASTALNLGNIGFEAAMKMFYEAMIIGGNINSFSFHNSTVRMDDNIMDSSMMFSLISIVLLSLSFSDYICNFKDKGMKAAENYLNLAIVDGSPIHIIRAYVLNTYYCEKVGNYLGIIANAERIFEMYSYVDHVSIVHVIGGGDRVPQCYAKALLASIKLGYFGEIDKYMTRINDILPQMSHLTSLAIVSTNLSSVLILCQRYDEVLDIFSRYYHLANCGSFNLLQDTNLINYRWVIELAFHFNVKSQAMFLIKYQNCLEIVALFEPNAQAEFDRELLRVLDEEKEKDVYVHPPHSHIRRAIESNTTAVELMQGELCMLKVWKTLKKSFLTFSGESFCDDKTTITEMDGNYNNIMSKWLKAGFSYLQYLKYSIVDYEESSKQQLTLDFCWLKVQLLLTVYICHSLQDVIDIEYVLGSGASMTGMIEQVSVLLDITGAIAKSENLIGVSMITSHFTAKRDYFISQCETNPIMCLRSLLMRWPKDFQ